MVTKYDGQNTIAKDAMSSVVFIAALSKLVPVVPRFGDLFQSESQVHTTVRE